jgi:hypothetical protein
MEIHHVINQVLCQYDHLGWFILSLNERVNIFFFIRNRDYPTMSSSRNGDYSRGGGGGGGPDRSYPSMRNSYMNARSRPYDSPYERQRMPPPPPMSYGDPYSMRGGPVDPYGRDDFYHQRAPPMPMPDHYGRGPPMRYVVIRT